MAKKEEQTNDWSSREVNAAIILASQTPSENESDFSDETECFDVDDHSRPLVDPASSSKPAARIVAVTSDPRNGRIKYTNKQTAQTKQKKQ